MRISDWSSDVCSSDLGPGCDSVPWLWVSSSTPRWRASHWRRSSSPSGMSSSSASTRKYSENFARSEEHTSELQSLMRISYAVFCLKKKKDTTIDYITNQTKSTQTHTSAT